MPQGHVETLKLGTHNPEVTVPCCCSSRLYVAMVSQVACESDSFPRLDMQSAWEKQDGWEHSAAVFMLALAT